MRWYRRIFRPPRQKKDAIRLLNLRCTRFRQLVRNYGKILDALADAAEKQGGDYILDRQYIVSLSEVVLDITESIIFDLNVLAEERYESFYAALDRFRSEIRSIVARDGPSAETPGVAAHKATKSRTRPTSSGPEKHPKTVAESRVLYRRKGQIACRGVAAGRVFNLEKRENADAFPEGAVMVASDITPSDELIRFMRRASAILTDFGEPAGETATLARESRIPTIVGLSDASARLETGTEVTVDADENTVYLGRVQEILEFYETENLSQEEEAEYRMLRRLRRYMFPLTLTEDVGPGAELGDCKTLHDLVHLAHELAAQTQSELVVGLGEIKNASFELATGLGIPYYAIDVGDGIAEPENESVQPGPNEIRSTPLKMFVSGMDQVLRRRTVPLPRASVTATVTEEHANMIVQQPGGFDIVDSMIGESKESNHIYCRFISGAAGDGGRGVRAAVAREVLARLDFAAAQTARATAAWLSRVPRADMEERMKIIGSLDAYLLETDAIGWDKATKEEHVDRFMSQHV
ncbi:MAG: PEP-utilizing enzyme [Candidatus Latescibacterota bacterium]|jgi:pyruvate,water dikinase